MGGGCSVREAEGLVLTEARRFVADVHVRRLIVRVLCWPHRHGYGVGDGGGVEGGGGVV